MTSVLTHITTSGGLISAAFIEAVREADARLPGLTPESLYVQSQVAWLLQEQGYDAHEIVVLSRHPKGR